MPRKPASPPHALRHIRQAAGKTQQEFAEILGVSRETILSIELGRMKMPSDLALKVRVETGCCLSEKQGPRGKRVFDVKAIAADTMKPYTPADFHEHRESMSDFYNSNPGELLAVCEAAVRAIDLLIHSAQRRGGGVMLAFVKDFEIFLAKSFESFGLAPFFSGYVAEQFGTDGRKKFAALNFPLAPLSTAFSYASSVEEEAAARLSKKNKSDAEVMPAKKKRSSPRRERKP